MEERPVAEPELRPKAGDVLRLKTGGPNMTAVGQVAAGTKIMLTWFTPDGELRHGLVDNIDMLEPVESFRGE